VGESQLRAGLESVKEVAAGPEEEKHALLAAGGGATAGEETRPVDSRRDLVGVDAKPVGERGLRLFLEAQRGQGLGAVHVGLGEVRVGREGEVELDERLRRSSGGSKRHAHSVSGLTEIRRHLQRVLEGHLGALEVACCEVLETAADLFERAGMWLRGGAGEKRKGDGEQEAWGAAGHGERSSQGWADAFAAKARGRNGEPGRAPGAGVERRPPGAIRRIDTTCVVT